MYDTFDLHVPNYHSFIAEGVVVHNTQQAIGHILWKVGHNVNELVKLVCASDKKAIKRLTQIRTLLKDSDDLHRIFPHLDMDRAVEWNKHMITLERARKAPEPTIEALGITSSGTGDRATGILVDDGVDRRNSITLPKTREAIKDSWDDWYNLLAPDSWLLWICTLWHNADLTHELMSNPEYDVLWYEINPETFGSMTRYPDGTEVRSDEPLWPERWGKKELAERKRVLKSRGFARSFSNRPMADAEKRVKPEWIRPWSGPPPNSWPRVVALDLASAQNADSDYTGVCAAAVGLETRSIKIVEAYHARLNFPEKIELVRYIYRTMKPEFLVVELAAAGRELAEFIVKKYGLPMRGIKPHGANKAVRLDAVTPLMESGVVTFNPALIRGPHEAGDLVAELENFGLYPTDDILDAFTHLIRFITVAYEAFDSDEAGEDPGEEREDMDRPVDAEPESTVLLI
jgi:predicted phage terminase large subunit-like protein